MANKRYDEFPSGTYDTSKIFLQADASTGALEKVNLPRSGAEKVLSFLVSLESTPDVNVTFQRNDFGVSVSAYFNDTGDINLDFTGSINFRGAGASLQFAFVLTTLGYAQLYDSGTTTLSFYFKKYSDNTKYDPDSNLFVQFIEYP